MARTLPNGCTSAFEYESALLLQSNLHDGPNVSLKQLAESIERSWNMQMQANVFGCHTKKEVRPRWSGGGWSLSCVQFSKPATVGRFFPVKLYLSMKWPFVTLHINNISVQSTLLVCFRALESRLIIESWEQHGIHIQSSHSPLWHHHLESWGNLVSRWL